LLGELVPLVEQGLALAAQALHFLPQAGLRDEFLLDERVNAEAGAVDINPGIGVWQDDEFRFSSASGRAGGWL